MKEDAANANIYKPSSALKVNSVCLLQLFSRLFFSASCRVNGIEINNNNNNKKQKIKNKVKFYTFLNIDCHTHSHTCPRAIAIVRLSFILRIESFNCYSNFKIIKYYPLALCSGCPFIRSHYFFQLLRNHRYRHRTIALSFRVGESCRFVRTRKCVRLQTVFIIIIIFFPDEEDN